MTTRRLMLAVAVVVIVVVACLAVLSYGNRVIFRAEASNNATMLQLNRDFEVRMRVAIDRLRQSRPGTPDEQESADRIFEMLRLSRVAVNSREVGSWERALHSSERTLIALKWAKVAADEAAYHAALCERWAVDYDQGRTPHHITDDEVPPFSMPAGWKEDDLK
jgi:hypothetical protein